MYDVNGKILYKSPCGLFYPPNDIKPYWDNRVGATILVPSMYKDNYLFYRFEGCETLEEFLRAVMYVYSIDHNPTKLGLMSRLAYAGQPVYKHSQYSYIKHYLANRRVFW